jgi:hypothetical protein
MVKNFAEPLQLSPRLQSILQTDCVTGRLRVLNVGRLCYFGFRSAAIDLLFGARWISGVSFDKIAFSLLGNSFA